MSELWPVGLLLLFFRKNKVDISCKLSPCALLSSDWLKRGVNFNFVFAMTLNYPVFCQFKEGEKLVLNMDICGIPCISKV